MLNRVRDFRYDEIKNWKPLVSLRESYRKESALKNLVLVATCIFAILIGYSLINGSLRITAAPPAQGAAVANSSGDAVREREVTAAATATPNPLAGVSGTDSAGIAQIPTWGTRGGLQQATFQNPVPDNRDGRLADGAVPGSDVQSGGQSSGQSGGANPARPTARARIAVCDVQIIINSELAAYAESLAMESQRALQAERESLYAQSQHFSDVEVLILQKLFEQKKQLAVVQIGQQLQQYRELVDRQLRAIADRVAAEYNFDLVVTADQVLSFTQPADITRLVNDLWLEQRQLQAQRDRQNRLGVR
jgi:Skp family chaperone for outer membrane proteins